jgi:pilus assembly protein CpaC
MIPRATTFRSALAAIIVVILVAAPSAQQATQFAAAAAPAAPAATREPGDSTTDIDLLVGRSTVLNVGNPIARVSLTVPDIADAMVTAPGQLLIHGKNPGTISLFVWDRGGAIKTYEVKVRRDLTALAAQLKQLFPGEPITAVGSGRDVLLSGTVSGQYVVDKAASVAAGYVEKKENVVNLLKQQEGVASNQVMLRVRFAEVSRSAVQELGASLFTGPTGYKDVIARTTTQQFAAPNFSELSRTADLDNHLTSAEGKYSLSDFLNIFVFSNKYNIGTVVRALQEKGLFQSLAEPNLIATNGKEASFLAGGEFPYPVVQGAGTTNSVTIMFKEFGVRLNFTPTVLGGDLINLKVRPEVSSLDFANSVTVSGFRVPALSTRRTETEVELRDGQTFAIAGLLNNTLQDSMRKIPGIGDVPILGWLFKSRALQKSQTELVVMITPTIIRRGQTGVSEALPSLVEPYLGAPSKRLPNPEPYVGSPRYPANQAAPRSSSEIPDAKPAVTATQPAPVTRPIQAPATLPQSPAPTPAATERVAPAPSAAPVAAPAPSVAPVAPKSEARPVVAPAPTKAELKALEKQRLEERKAAEAAAKLKAAEDIRKGENEKAAQKKAEEDRRAAEKLDKERAAREAEVARKNAEIARKKAEEDRKRDKVLAAAAARLKEAQAAYQAEIAKAKGIKK